MGANLVVKFCGKSQILRTKNTCLFEQNFLNTITESTKNSNISSQSNKKRFIERANQSECCKYVKLKSLFYTQYILFLLIFAYNIPYCTGQNIKEVIDNLGKNL